MFNVIFYNFTDKCNTVQGKFGLLNLKFKPRLNWPTVIHYDKVCFDQKP